MLLIAHGGAGDGMPGKAALDKLSESLAAGYGTLREGGTALDAVTETIAILEDSGLFNAGAGGRVQLDGVRRLDASLMEGRELGAGSVVGLEGIRNPVKAARAVMGLPHVMLTNIGARRLAEVEGLAPLPKRLRSTGKREGGTKEALALYEKYFSTVGAVALDSYGDLAAGASTGGISAMLPGRVGDTPVIGAGVYAENATGAVSCTGLGEAIIRLSLAKEICMGLKEATPRRAADCSLKRLLNIGGSGGVIVVTRQGRHAIMHTTKYMASGYAGKRGITIEDSSSSFNRWNR